MVYLHCGWPKTGTTSLQVALASSANSLAKLDLVYPDKWRRDEDNSHNGLTDLLRSSRHSNVKFDEVRRFLEAHSERDVLLSSESLSLWVGAKKDVLLSFLMTIQEVSGIKCIWTLRRLDDLLQSLYIQMSLGGHKLPPPAEFMNNIATNGLSMNMRKLAEDVAEVAYVKYDSAGRHNRELLRAFGLPQAYIDAVEREIHSAPRRNVSRTHKQFVATTNVGILSTMLGLPIDRRVLLNAFDHEDLQFEDDGPCILVDQDVRQSLHERMLESSARYGFDSYIEFFGADEIHGSPTRLNPDVLSDEDLGRLATHLQLKELG